MEDHLSAPGHVTDQRPILDKALRVQGIVCSSLIASLFRLRGVVTHSGCGIWVQRNSLWLRFSFPQKPAHTLYELVRLIPRMCGILC